MWLVFASAVIVTVIFTPKYLVAQRPGKSKKSLGYKMICSTMFLIAGFTCVKLGSNTTLFAVFMVFGLIFSWIGDFSLHAGEKKRFFVIGLFFFMTAHIMYLVAYNNVWHYFFPGKPFLNIAEIIIILSLFMLCVVYIIVSKIKQKNALLIPTGVYVIVLNTMFVKAAAISIKYLSIADPNNKYNIAAALLLAFGAFFFLLSDASLGILMFNKKHKSNFPLKCFNIITYFGGQLMLASTILFFKTDII